MKKLIVIALLLMAFSGVGVRGQDQDQNQNKDDEQVRDLFVSYAATGSKGKPGAKIKIERLRDGKRQFVPLDAIFQSGDRIKLYFETNFPAFVELYNLGSSGGRQKLFPYAGASSRVKITSSYVVPYKATEWFEFDDRPGIERLSFIFSSAPIQPPASSSAHKRPSSAKKPVRPAGKASAEEAQQAFDKFDQARRGIDEEDEEDSRDFKRVQVKDDYYILGNQQRLQRAVKIAINLQHR